jgi:hypothetical protein
MVLNLDCCMTVSVHIGFVGSCVRVGFSRASGFAPSCKSASPCPASRPPRYRVLAVHFLQVPCFKEEET